MRPVIGDECQPLRRRCDETGDEQRTPVATHRDNARRGEHERGKAGADRTELVLQRDRDRDEHRPDQTE